METFVLRVWTPASGNPGADATSLHGLVEHVRSGDSTPFTGEEELLRLLRAGLQAGDRDVVEGGTQ